MAAGHLSDRHTRLQRLFHDLEFVLEAPARLQRRRRSVPRTSIFINLLTLKRALRSERHAQTALSQEGTGRVHTAIPTQKSVDRFKDQIRASTQRKIPLRMGELIKMINPIIRGWGNDYCRSNVRKRFHQLDRWIIRRLWSHRAKRWRNACWTEYPIRRLRDEFKLVSLVWLIPSLQIVKARS
ncbi:group II intron maturase-specific domain-containing protein [Microvirga tunisiensis]|uniref:Group II intron maturase-specific domain-containing protein n=1 Tax=Microvirga tunisiensis TaxID=2108360 RepID=A0A5N7MTD4_9HYPH|nr:hypothetical protein [Microvirga tunisiensis]MPR30128.1 hypothetical protein [Microvirga tunisiensis]